MQLRRLLIRLVIIAAIPGLLALGYLWRAKSQIATLKQQCEEAYQAEQWEALERAAVSWYQWQPEIARPLIYAAQAATERGNLLLASVYLNQLPDEDEESIPGLMELSDLQFRPLNQPLAAAETWRRILRIDPDNSEAHRRLIFFYTMARMRGKLIEETRRGIEVGCDVPETYVYLFGADWMTFTNGAEVNSRWLEGVQGYEPFEVARAFHYARTGAISDDGQERDEDGVSLIEKRMVSLLAKYPSNVELLAYHLELATYRADMEKVLLLLKQAPPESVNDSRFWRHKGWVHSQRNELDEAVAAYQKAATMHPFDGLAHHELAALYRRTNKVEKVKEHQELSALGLDIMRTCLAMPSTDEIPTELLSRMAAYSQQVGEKQVATRLNQRITQRAVGSAADHTPQ